MTEIQIESILETACEICVMPTKMTTEDELMEFCYKCPLERKLREVLADAE